MGTLIRNRSHLAPCASPWELQDELSQLWPEFDYPFGWIEKIPAGPALDLRETPEAFIVEADVPGLKKEEVQIEVTDKVVSLRGERWNQREDNKENYHFAERKIGRFHRTVEIPGGFDAEKAAAKFENGVLTITLPKPEEKKARKIDVRVD